MKSHLQIFINLTEINRMHKTALLISLLCIVGLVILTITTNVNAATGDECTNPIVVNIPDDLNYTDSYQTTCGRINDYYNTCLGVYDGGEDIIYRLDVTIDTQIDVTMDPKGTTWTSLMIDDNCPGVDGTCIDSDYASSGIRVLTDINLTAGNSYYIMVDTWPSPDCIPDFNLTITGFHYEPQTDGPYGVGGEVHPVNTLELLDSYIVAALAVTVLLGLAVASLRRRNI
jgi:hypothetical protein